MPQNTSKSKKKSRNPLKGFTEGELLALKGSISSQGAGFIWKDRIENELKNRPLKK
jgi:hypothetical protein